MSLLSDIGGWIRNGVDDVGSLITGQPAHGAPQQQQPQPQQPQQQQPQGLKPPQLIVRQNPATQVGLQVQQPQQQQGTIAVAKPPATPQLQGPNPLTQKNQLAYKPPKPATSFGDLKINMPNVGQVAGGVGQALRNPMEAAEHAVGIVAAPVTHAITQVGSELSGIQSHTPLGYAARDVVGPIVQGFGQTGQHGAALLQGHNPYHGTAPQIAGQIGGDVINAASVIPGGEALKGAQIGLRGGEGLAKQVLKSQLTNAAYGVGYGATSAMQQKGATPVSVVKSGALGGGTGALIGTGIPIAGAGLRKGIDVIRNMGDSGHIGLPGGSDEPTNPTAPTPEHPGLTTQNGVTASPEFHQAYPTVEPSSQVTPEEYAQAFNVTPDQAKTDMASGPTAPEIRAGNAAADPQPMSIAEREQAITQGHQQTNNQIELNPQVGSPQAAIAQAQGHAAEMQSRFDYANHLGSKLDLHDQQLLSERADPNVKITPHDPEAFTKAAAAHDDAYDFALAARRAAGDPTLRFGGGKYSPLSFKITPEEAETAGLPEESLVRDKHGKVVGFHDQTRKYRSYTQAKNDVGLERLNESPLEDLRNYAAGAQTNTRNGLLRKALEISNPDEIADEGAGFEVNPATGKKVPFKQAAGNLPFYTSKAVNDALKNYKSVEPTNIVTKTADKAASKVGGISKKALFIGTPFHAAHITENFASAAALGGEPGAVAKGIVDEFKTKGGLSKGSYYEALNNARQDGTLDYARRMGIALPEHSGLDRSINTYALQLAKVAKNGGIDAASQDGIDLARIYNRLLGRVNAPVEGLNPLVEKMTSYFALAPHYLRTQLHLVLDAVAPKKLGGAGYDRALKLTTPGGAARSAVVGPRLFGALLAVTASAIVMQRFPSWQDAVNESGLNPNNPNPNIDIKGRNAKGESQVMNLPTDPVGLAIGFLTDPSHFAISRESPALSFGTKVVTNKNWNGQPLVDTNQPNAWPLRLARAAENSFMPIGLQNFTNLQNNPSNPSIAQGTLQEFGLRLKTNPNDPQASANKDYFNALTQASNDLKNQGQYGQYWAQQFANLHPANTTDAAGNKYPTPYNPVSGESKYAAYTAVNGAGQQVLSPVFEADKKLNNMTPNYPGSPLYKLNGTGVDASGNQSPQALVALQYQHAQDPAAKQVLMNANGGQTGWLAKYENDLGNYSQNYQGNMNKYFQSLGWQPKAIDQYWSKHPSTPDPISTVNFDKPTTDLISQYYALSASGDSTGAAQFFSKNADTLGNAFDIMAQHANALRSAKGELQIQGYPTESDHVKAILSSMPSGSDTASKKARSVLINSNPDVNQYLANTALYEATSNGAQLRYKNPANMNATEGDAANNTQAGQKFIKAAYSLGSYDIGYNKTTGQYNFMQNGTVAPGSKTGGSSGYSKSSKIPLFVKKFPKGPKAFYAKRQHKTSLGNSGSVRVTKAGGVKVGKPQAIKMKKQSGIALAKPKTSKNTI